MRNVYAQGYEDKKCVCCQKSKLDDGKCGYEGFCQRSLLVYELICTTTGKSYIGKTQNYLRKRTQEHVDTVWKLIEWKNRVKNGKIDPKKPKKFSVTAFSKHFAKYCVNCQNSNQVRQMMKKLMSPRIIWQGERVKCMKTARTLQCTLCMVERKEIMHRMNEDRASVINDNSDRFSTCTCFCDFHCFKTRKPNADTEDGSNPEKSPKRNHQSKIKRKKHVLKIDPKIAKIRQHSTCMTERTILRPGKAPLIDTNVPGLPMEEPVAKPSWFRMERMREFMRDNMFRTFCDCCSLF